MSHHLLSADKSANYPSDVKLLDLQSGRYISGRLQHEGGGETVIELPRTRQFLPGRELKIAIATQSSGSLIKASDMRPVVVVRHLRTEGNDVLAVRYADSQPLAKSA